MKFLFWLVQDKKVSKLIFWCIAFLGMISNHILPKTASQEAKDLAQYLVLALAFTWGLIYTLVPKQETEKEIRNRRIGVVVVFFLIIVAYLIAK